VTRAGYLGPEGTNSHEALLASGADVRPIALPTLRDVVLAVQDGRVDHALVPVENALEGGVDPVLDALALEAPDVVLVGELVHPVSYCLAAAGELPLDAVRVVVSHPQALAQCARFLRQQLPEAGVVAAASTADAVRAVAGEAAGAQAALGTPLAAARYGARILAEHVEDEPENATRFAWIARAGAGGEACGAQLRGDADPAAPAKTALVFWGAGSSSAGWLVGCLAAFAARGINLTRIESRPLRRGLGEYMFFLDLAGSTADPPVADALAELGERAEVVRLLGSFPAAETPAPAPPR
jgi:prephenate dehydratase